MSRSGSWRSDGSEVGCRVERPDDGEAERRSFVSRQQRPELSEHLFVRDALSRFERGAGAVERGHRLWGGVLRPRLEPWPKGAGERLDQNFEEVMDGEELFLWQHVEQQVGLLTLLYEIEFHSCSRFYLS